MFTGYGVEDPATGSATAAASGLQAELRGTAKLDLCIRQGVDMGRPSTLFTKVNRELDGTLVVKLYGRGVIVMDGNVRAPQALG
jgi:trans-2,3-dihydro-3-hydroxyanthranilate isomerase